jgi:predicted enzyme related to lactoylglutathione lyase
MKRGSRRAVFAGMLAVVAIAMAGTAASAGVSLNGVRIGAKDVAPLAKFYQTAFGMQEVQRIQTPEFLEIMLNFGASVDAAKANTAGDLVIMQRPSDDVKDEMPHVVFDVTDMAATVKALKAAGGKMEREPFEYGNTGIVIGMAIDPAGNHFEMIQQPKR